MSKDMRVEGVSYPHPGEGERPAGRRVRFVRPGQFIWLGVALVLWLMVAFYGTPHLRFKYQYTGAPSAPIYFSCDYIGLHSRRLMPPNGKCPLLKILKPTE